MMRRSRAARWFVLVSILAGLLGCATVYEGKYPYSEGWRKETVDRVVRASAIENPTFSECLRRSSVEDRAKGSYVLLSYAAMGRTRTRLVQQPEGIELMPGELVYFNATECRNAIAKRPAGA